MTLSFELDLDRIKMDHYVKYPCQTSSCPKFIVQTHTPDRLLYLDH